MREVIHSASKAKSKEKRQASMNIVGNQTALQYVAGPGRAVVQRKPIYDKRFPGLQGPLPPILAGLGGVLIGTLIGLMAGVSPENMVKLALLGGALGALAAIVLAQMKKKRTVNLVGYSKSLESIRDGSKVPSIDTRRVGTSVSSATGTRREGQHTIPFIGESTFIAALVDSGNSPRELMGTRLMPTPKTEEKIAERQMMDAVSRGVVTPAEAHIRRTRMVQSYEQRYTGLSQASTSNEELRAAMSVMSYEATAAHGQYDPLTHAQLKGKGERRTTAARELLGQGPGRMLDTTGVPAFTARKAQKKLSLMSRLAQSRGASVELSEDTEADDY